MKRPSDDSTRRILPVQFWEVLHTSKYIFSEIKSFKVFFFYLILFFIWHFFFLILKLFYFIQPWKRNQRTQGKIPTSKLEQNFLIATSNIWKCAQGADLAAAEVCHFWHLKSSPISLKLNYHQFAFLMTKNGPLQAEIRKFGYQQVFFKKKSKN